VAAFRKRGKMGEVRRRQLKEGKQKRSTFSRKRKGQQKSEFFKKK